MPDLNSVELASLLADLKAAGKIDSGGNFTLDLERTLEKMSRFQLQEPHRYPLNAVAAATLGGATFVNVFCDADNTVLFDDAAPLSRTDLGELFHSLFESGLEGQRKRLQELAIAVNAARSMDPRFICFDSWHEGKGNRLQISGGQLMIAPLVECPWKERGVVNRLHVRERLSLRTVQKHLGNKPEGDALLRYTGMGPAPVWVNGLRAGSSLADLEFLSVVHFHSPECQREFPLNAAQRHQAKARFSGSMGLAVAPPERAQWLHVIVNGVTFSMPFEDRFPPGFRAWIEAPYLSKDLSQGSLVRNEPFEEMLARLDQECLEMVHRLARITEVNRGAGARTAGAIGWLLKRTRYGLEQGAAQELGGDLRLLRLADGTPIVFSELVDEAQKLGAIHVSASSCEPGCARTTDGASIVQGGGWAGEILDKVFPSNQIAMVCSGPLAAPMRGGDTLLGAEYLARVAIQMPDIMGTSQTYPGQMGLARATPGDFFRVTIYVDRTLAADRAMRQSTALPYPHGVEIVMALSLPRQMSIASFESRLTENLAGLLEGGNRFLKDLYRQLAWPSSQDTAEALGFSLDHLLAALDRATFEHGVRTSDPELRKAYPDPWETLRTARSSPRNPLNRLASQLELETLVDLKLLPSVKGLISVSDLVREPQMLALKAPQRVILQNFLPKGAML